ncbi:MAG: CAP domain-containing protein [Clostridia bacterium]|nr:CAP domain-containing protein [Clostridia bacterium]
MRNKAISIILTLIMVVGMVPVASITASADDEIVDVTIFGTCNYDGANEIVEKTNEARAAEGLDALVMDVQLTEWAMQRAAELAIYYSHTRPDGSSRLTVTNDFSFTNYVSSGENGAISAYGSDVVATWMNSSGHRAQILRSDYDAIGVGCVTIGAYSYYVQWFAAYEDANERGDYSYVAVQSTCSGTKTTTFTISTYTSNLKNIDISHGLTHMAIGQTTTVSLRISGYYASVLKVVPTSSTPSIVKDENTGEVIATTSVSPDGTVTITPTAAGTGYLYLYPYEGASPQSVELVIFAGYTVTFDSDGGSSVPSQTVAYNSSAAEPTAPSKKGYVFDGWYSIVDQYDEEQDDWNQICVTYDFSTTVTEDITLYASWKADTTSTTTKDSDSETSSEPVETTTKSEETTTLPTEAVADETTAEPDEETTAPDETTGTPDESETTDDVTEGTKTDDFTGTTGETGTETTETETVTDGTETEAENSSEKSDTDSASVVNNSDSGDDNGGTVADEENGSYAWAVVLVVLLVAAAGAAVFVVLKKNKSGETANAAESAETDESTEAENDGNNDNTDGDDE